METIGIFGIIGGILYRYWPVWAALVVVYLVAKVYKRRLGPFGRLFDSWMGTVGTMICLFWLFTAVFSHIVAPFDPRVQIAIMKNALPGAIEPQSHIAFLLGGDQLARDVFSRMVHGARIVLSIAPKIAQTSSATPCRSGG